MYVTITFDKPRRVRFNHNAIADIEDASGSGISKMMTDERREFALLRYLVWAGLKHGGERGMTLERAGTLIDAYLASGRSGERLWLDLVEGLKTGGVWRAPDDEAPEGEPEGNRPTPATPPAD